MMKIYLANDSRQGLGGGFTFLRNLKKGLIDLGHQTVDKIEECDIFFISGVTMVSRDTFRRAQELNKKIVTRCDNVPRNSRNRNTGTSRLYDYCRGSTEIVYQCKWAREYLIDFIKREGVIIYNGVDTDIFKPDGPKCAPSFLLRDCKPIYLYSRFNRDETKNWEVAWYEYQLIQRDNPKAGLIIVGKFSPEHQKYNFDFFRDENYAYLPTIDRPEMMADIYRGSDYLMAPYYNDCYSNTYLEALACGVRLYKPNMTGGTPELIRNGIGTIHGMAKNYEKLFEKLLEKKAIA